MSVMRISEPDRSGGLPPCPPRRVREQARDVVALMAFSAAASLGCSLLFLLPGLGR